MSFTEHHYRSKDGLSLYYRQYGDAGSNQVVLCLHGLTRNSKDFQTLAEHLAERYRVITVDVRGRGQSDRDPHPIRYNPGQYVKDAWQLLDLLQLQQVTVIGTSLGGLMAMIMADQQPKRLRAVVLNDIGPELPLPAIQRIMSYAGRYPPAQNWEEAALQVKAAYEIAMPDMPMEFWRDFVRLSYRENAAGRPEPDMDPAIGKALREPPPLVKWLQWMNRHGWVKRVAGVHIDPWDSFHAVTMPCLLVHGAISDVLTGEIVRKMQHAQPHMQLVRVANRGHAPLLNEPEALEAIDGFLDTVHQP
jgi:pimeloyl-ACP methyl ester carboxylesterase